MKITIEVDPGMTPASVTTRGVGDEATVTTGGVAALDGGPAVEGDPAAEPPVGPPSARVGEMSGPPLVQPAAAEAELDAGPAPADAREGSLPAVSPRGGPAEPAAPAGQAPPFHGDTFDVRRGPEIGALEDGTPAVPPEARGWS